MADIVLLFILKGRDCMSKVLIEVLVIILIAGSYLILYSAVRVSAISEQRIAEIRSRETFDKEKQLKTNQSSISGGMAMTNKEKKIEGRLGYNSENGRYGLLVSDLWEHTGFHCGECLEVKVDDKWVKTRMEMDIARNWYLVDTPYTGDANCMYMRNYEKKALIKQNIYQLDKFNDDYNFYGFVSQIEEKGNKKASIINYIISEEDLIKNHSFKIINFFHDLLDKQKLLMYNQIGVRGVLLNCENTDIKDAEIIFEMIEECQLDWVVIGGGEHISIGQRRYEKFVNKINNKSNWTPISL